MLAAPAEARDADLEVASGASREGRRRGPQRLQEGHDSWVRLGRAGAEHPGDSQVHGVGDPEGLPEERGEPGGRLRDRVDVLQDLGAQGFACTKLS